MINKMTLRSPKTLQRLKEQETPKEIVPEPESGE